MKRTKLRKHSKSPISKLKKEAWRVFSLFIRARDKYICFTCDKDLKGSRTLHAGHFISRRVNATLFDEINVAAQCMYCNLYNYGASGEFARRLIKKYGQKEFNNLLERGREYKQWDEKGLREIVSKYEPKA